MVVGIHKSLEMGHVYSREDLREKFGVGHEVLDSIIGNLMEKGHLEVLFHECVNGDLSVSCITSYDNLRWQAV